MLNSHKESNATLPVVSVVIGVHNGANEVEATLRSILDQQGVDFELIVVDDGSSDQTPVVLDRLATNYSRLKLIRQSKNEGLTKALILGCQQAQGKYIARQDIGDVSLPGRLFAQVQFLEKHAGVAISSCWTRIVGPEQEFLAANCPTDSPQEATQKLLNGIAGVTHHGAVMFRTDAYHKAGGYRSEFYFAQDLDLWYRLLQIGQLAFLPEVLYQVQITPKCLSSRYREQQIELAAIIAKLAKNSSDPKIQVEGLCKAARIRPENCHSIKSSSTVVGEYWIASMLIQQADPRAASYLTRAIAQKPWFLKAWVGFIRLALSMLSKYFQRITGTKPHETSAGF